MLYGFIHNALPYYLPRFFVRSHRYEPETIGSVKIVTDIVIFLLYYLVLWGTAFLLTNIHIAFIYTITLPLSGLVTLLFDEYILQQWLLWQGLMLPSRRRYCLTKMSEERAAIVRDLDAMKKHYLKVHS